MSMDWIKFMTNTFDDRKIQAIRNMPEIGRSLVLIWLHMLTEAGKTNDGGWIYLTKDRGYSVHELAKNFDEPAQNIEIALRAFQSFGMVEVDDYNRIYIVNWYRHQSVEALEDLKEKERERKALYRRANALVQILIDEGHSRKKIESLLKTRGKYDYEKVQAWYEEMALVKAVPGHVPSKVRQVPSIERELELEKESLKPYAQRPAKIAQIGARSLDSFEKFWALYPNKKGKDRAWKKWQMYWRAGALDVEKVMSGTQAYAQYIDWQRKNRKDFSESFVKHGDTFVNNKAWDDDWSIPTVSGSRTRNVEVTADDPDPLGIDEALRKAAERRGNRI